MMYLSLVIFVFSSSLSLSLADVYGAFRLSSICNVPQRLLLGCSYEVSRTRNLMDCSRQCFKFDGCNGVSLDRNGNKCFIHKDCPYVLDCKIAEENHTFLERHCLHGSWNALTKSCECQPGFRGDRCEIHPPGCFNNSFSRETVNRELYRILVDPEQSGKDPIPVACGYNGTSLIIFRNKGRGEFNRTWEEYKRGFYIDDDHQWLGLDAWHRLGKAGCAQIWMRLNLNKDGSDFPNTYHRYKNFYLYDETMNYQSKFQGYGKKESGMPGGWNMANCIWDLKAVPFSTWDRDNDGDTVENCAARAGAGWWYPHQGCGAECNVLGLGIEHWNSTPSLRHINVAGADLNSWMTAESYMDLSFFEC